MNAIVVKKKEAKDPATDVRSTNRIHQPVRILKIANCESLSARSTITYQVGCAEDPSGNQEIRFRIKANTGRGFFSKEWITSATIQSVFESIPQDAPVTSMSFIGTFLGKSVNTSGFLLAALMAEGLIAPVKGKGRCYQRVESNAFVDEIKHLMDSSVSLKDDDKPGQAKGVKKSIQTGRGK